MTELMQSDIVYPKLGRGAASHDEPAQRPGQEIPNVAA
jgi:hypothetical protein